MRLLYVVQRYGEEVPGGAELYCRQYATRLAARGHEVDVLTSCAVSHVDWANHYPEGETELDGVRIHRLAVAGMRDERFFLPLSRRVLTDRWPTPLHLQRRWMMAQGPVLPGLVPWLTERAGGYQAVIFFTYLYHPTWAGLPAVSARVPTVLHPFAHDEPPLRLPIFDLTFRHPSAFAFATEEEAALVDRRFGVSRPSAVIGIGVDGDGGAGADEAAFRQAYGLDDRPYLLFMGRVEPGKGSLELFQFFTAYKRRHPGPLALVVMGVVVDPLPEHPDVVCAGFVDEATKRSALAGALALVQPSFLESFSIVLTEAWGEGKAALVQGHCDVLAGQARRSGGGIPYRGFAEFEVALDRLLGDAALRTALGEAGRRFVEHEYRWDSVLQRYEDLLGDVTGRRSDGHRRNRGEAEPPAVAPDVDGLVAEVRATVEERRRADAFPPGLEDGLAAYTDAILSQRGDRLPDDLRGRLEALHGTLPFDTHRIPLASDRRGGVAVHRAVARLVAPEVRSILEAAEAVARPMEQTLEILIEAVERLQQVVRVEVRRHLGTLYEAAAARERAAGSVVSEPVDTEAGGERLVGLVAELRSRVEERRRSGVYPAGLEEDLSSHFQRILSRGGREAVDVRGPLAEVARALPLQRERIGLASEVPGGAPIHRAVARLVGRQTQGVLEQVQAFAQPARQALEALAAAVDQLEREVGVEIAQHLQTLYEHQAAQEREGRSRPAPPG